MLLVIQCIEHICHEKCTMVFLFFSHDGLEREIRKDQAGLAAKCPTENGQKGGLSEVNVLFLTALPELQQDQHQVVSQNGYGVQTLECTNFQISSSSERFTIITTRICLVDSRFGLWVQRSILTTSKETVTY